MEGSLERFEDYIYVWGPRILAAVVILVVAHFAAKAVKWGIARLVDRVPGVSGHNAGAPKNETVGAKLGEVGYWLVWLIGLIAALNALQLGQIVQPLNQMQAEFFEYIPRIVGAGLIFFVGYLVATLARRVVETALTAANVDGWLQKAGLSRITGASGLARTVGTLVFVLIIIPVAISALNTLQIAAISTPAVAVLSTVLSAIPRLIAAAIVLGIAFVIGRWVSGVVEQLLSGFGFDSSIRGLTSSAQGTQASGLAGPADPASATAGGGYSPSRVVGNIAMVAIMVFAAVEAANLLNFGAMSVFLAEILSLGGRVLFGGAIIAAGVIIATVVSNLIDRSTGGADGFASNIIKWATIALSVAIGLSFMDVADEIIVLAFGLILGSAAVAFALAFGIGGALSMGLGGREQGGRLMQKVVNMVERQGASQPTPPQAPTPTGYTPPPAE
jgi:hypothetical protein